MTRDIVVHFIEILIQNLDFQLASHFSFDTHTDTKKLVVPSCRSNIPGNSFSHVSSPYMTRRPPGRALIWASHVSWWARVDDVSDSAKLRITSRNDGTEPVVMAFTRGIVIVGELARAVNGNAEPFRIKLLSLG